LLQSEFSGDGLFKIPKAVDLRKRGIASSKIESQKDKSFFFKNKKIQTDEYSSTKISEEENNQLSRHVQNPKLSKTRNF
jgi:hypothetical protein